MELGFGGPVWHASARDLKGEKGLEIARSALRKVGGEVVEEREQINGMSEVGQLRKRLTREEAERFGVSLRDWRGETAEVRRAWEAAWPWLQKMPREVVNFAMREVMEVSGGSLPAPPQ